MLRKFERVSTYSYTQPFGRGHGGLQPSQPGRRRTNVRGRLADLMYLDWTPSPAWSLLATKTHLANSRAEQPQAPNHSKQQLATTKSRRSNRTCTTNTNNFQSEHQVEGEERGSRRGGLGQLCQGSMLLDAMVCFANILEGTPPLGGQRRRPCRAAGAVSV